MFIRYKQIYKQIDRTCYNYIMYDKYSIILILILMHQKWSDHKIYVIEKKLAMTQQINKRSFQKL